MYEISRLINQVIGGERNKKRDIVRGLGFEHDLLEGYNRLENLFRTGRCHEKIRKRLPKTLNLLPNRVKEALEETTREVERQKEISLSRREEYARRTFRPYLWINHIYSQPKDRVAVDHIDCRWTNRQRESIKSSLTTSARPVDTIICLGELQTTYFAGAMMKIICSL